MIKVTMRYPGDPPTEAVLMYGAEFHKYIRGGKPGKIVINGDVIAEFDEIVCDVCNAEVGLISPCAIAMDYLYCATCMAKLTEHFDLTTVRVST